MGRQAGPQALQGGHGDVDGAGEGGGGRGDGGREGGGGEGGGGGGDLLEGEGRGERCGGVGRDLRPVPVLQVAVILLGDVASVN